MLKAFLENCKRPQGGFGRLILRGMNSGHGPVAGWAFDRMEWPVNGRILDIGCGGGGNIARLLRRLPGCRVDGVDYSGESVAVSRRVNARQADRCRVVRGDVMALPREPYLVLFSRRGDSCREHGEVVERIEHYERDRHDDRGCYAPALFPR